MTEALALWSYLAQEPLLWLTLTLGAYVAAEILSQLAGRHALANPVLIAVILLAAVVRLTGTPYNTYFEGAQFGHFMLGPATVGLALPLYLNLSKVRRALWPMLAALLAGSLVAMAESKGCYLPDLTLEDMQSVHAEITDDVYSVLTVQNSVNSRQSYGGTAPDQVRAQVERWKAMM